jgi:hypothetical protein
MTRAGRRAGDDIGAKVLRAMIREVRRRAPQNPERISFRLAFFAQVDADGVIAISEPALSVESAPRPRSGAKISI